MTAGSSSSSSPPSSPSESTASWSSRSSGRVLLIEAGDLPSLVAAFIQTSPADLVLWAGRFSHEPQIEPAWLAKKSEALGGAAAERIDLGPLAGASERTRMGIEGQRLMRAAGDALAMGIPRIVWPAVVGPDPDDAGEALELAAAIGDVATIGVAGPDDLVIDAPLVDREGWEVVDLADDMSLPLGLARPCGRSLAGPCGGCSECDRWRAAFHQAGVAWPWTEPASAGAGIAT
jgi:hypothetical protein